MSDRTNVGTFGWALSAVAMLIVGCGPAGSSPTTSGSSLPRKIGKQPSSDDSATDGPGQKTVEKVAPVAGGPAAKVYPVELSNEHAKTCKIRQGSTMPAFALRDLDGKQHTLSSLRKDKLTVVLFFSTETQWKRESENALVHFQYEKKKAGVAYLGINVGQPRSAVKATVAKTQVKFPILLDTNKRLFGQVATDILPRVYLLDEQGGVVWFAIRYQPPDTIQKLNLAIEFMLKDGEKE